MRGAYSVGAPTAEVFREVIETGQAAGEFGADVDPRAAALFLFDAYIGVITRWFGTRPAERFDLRAGLRQALTVVLYGISAQRLPARPRLVRPPGPGLRSLTAAVSSPLPRSRRLFASSRPRGISMTLYMYQASYTARSMAAQLKEPHDPVEAIRPTLEDLGARIVVAGFPFGDYDVLVVYEAPDDMTAASVAMAIAAAGEVKSGKTTRLLSGQEWLESLRKRRIVNTRKVPQPHDPHGQLSELLSGGGRSAQT